MNLSEAGITSYCYQVCGSRGSASCGTGDVCQYGIDVNTQMPAQVTASEDEGHEDDAESQSQLNKVTFLSQQYLENDGITGIGFHGAITAMLPYWKSHLQDGAKDEFILRDLRELKKQIEDCIDVLEIPF